MELLDQRQCFEGIWEVVHYKEKQEWAYHGDLRNITAHWSGSREFSTDVHSRDPSRRVCFNSPHGDITNAERNFWLTESKSLGKIKVDGIVHHARHRFAEDQQIG